MGLLARIFGICKTKPPKDTASWEYSDEKVTIELGRVPEISNPGGAIRLEGKGLAEGIFLFHGTDGKFYAFRNKCTHMGRRLDMLAETETIQCCSISKSTFDYAGNVISGPATDALKMFPVEVNDDKVLTVKLI